MEAEGLSLEEATRKIGGLREAGGQAQPELQFGEAEEEARPNAWMASELGLGQDEEASAETASDEVGGDEEAIEAEAEGAEAEAEQPAKVKVALDGEEVELTPEEIADLYRRAKAPALPPELADIHQKALQYEQGLQLLAQQIARDAGQEPDWDKLYQENPLEFVREKAKWDRIRQQQAALAAEYQASVEQRMKMEEAAYRQRLEAEMSELAKRIPEFRDESKRKQLQREIRDYARSIGFSEEELSSVSDHRAVVALWKAMQYDRVMSRQKGIQPKPSKAIRPGNAGNVAPGSNNQRNAIERFRRDPSVANAAEAIRALRTKH